MVKDALLASASLDETVRLWDTRAQKCVTVLRGLAIMCPNFVERLFEPQIKLGRSLGDFWKRYRTLAPTLLATLLICSV